MSIGYEIGQPLQSPGDFEVNGDLSVAGNISQDIDAAQTADLGVVTALSIGDRSGSQWSISASGAAVLASLNNSNGGITNAGAITGATSITMAGILAGARFNSSIYSANGAFNPAFDTDFGKIWFLDYNGAMVITLPEITAGSHLGQWLIAFQNKDQNTQFAKQGSDSLFAPGSAGTASTLTFQTTNEKQGASALVIAMGWNWLVLPLYKYTLTAA